MKPFADTTLPGLATALDMGAVLDLLRRALPECGDNLELTGGKIVDVRYEPGAHCVLLYRLKFRNRATRRSTRQLLSARLLRVDECQTSPAQELLARYDARHKNVIRTPMLYLPEARMVTYSFPIDTSLPWLFDALDPSTMKRGLNRIWAQRKVQVRKVTLELLGYTPQARATFLYEVLSEAKDRGEPELRRLVGKMHAHKGPARLFASAWALWRAADGSVGLAPPVGYIPSLRLTLQEQVHGQRLGGLASSPSFVKLVRQTARAIAAMHGLSLPLPRRRTPQDEARVVHRWGGVLTGIRPDLAWRAERLRDRLAAEIEARAQVAGPVHGDFHHTNVLVDGDHITLIDLDEIAYGDPLVDVGRFLASLRIPALRAFGNPSGLAEAGEAFLDEYLTLTPEDERRVRLFEAASLLTTASASFRIQRPGWEEEVTMFVEAAEQVFRKAGHGAVVLGVSKVREVAAPVEDWIRWATDGIYMQALLDPYIREAYGAEVTACRVATERETENGYRIRYDLSGWRGDEKWAILLHGIVRRERGGRVLFRHLSALRLALAEHPEAPLLPRPIAYLSQLKMQVVEAPCGVRFSALVGTPEALEAAKKVARALAALHHSRMELEKSCSLDDELLALRRRIERLEAIRPGLYTRAVALLAQVDRQSRAVPARITPILRTLPPHHILCLGDRVAVAEVEEVTLSHPLIDVGNFLARLTLMGITRGKVQEVAEVADRFRHAYIAAGGVSDNGVAVFEAGALLRLACTQAERDPQRITAERLLACAEGRLAAS
ncbi:MAG: aminoglycoside phosphotransferase family protein [Acidobacteriota bacterium]